MCLPNYFMKFHQCLFKILKTKTSQSDGWTDGQREKRIHPLNTVCGAYNFIKNVKKKKKEENTRSSAILSFRFFRIFTVGWTHTKKILP